MVNPETSAMIVGHMVDIRRAFAELLARRLGQSVEEVCEDGLRSLDFRVNESIEVTLADGSMMQLRYAFFVHDEQQGMVGIFTEHCGYHCFSAIDLELRELVDGVVVAQHRW